MSVQLGIPAEQWLGAVLWIPLSAVLTAMVVTRAARALGRPLVSRTIWRWLPVATGAGQTAIAFSFLDGPEARLPVFEWLQTGSGTITLALVITPFAAWLLALLAWVLTAIAVGDARQSAPKTLDQECLGRATLELAETSTRILALQTLVPAVLLADSLGAWLLFWTALQLAIAALLKNDGHAEAARRLAYTAVFAGTVGLFGLTQTWMMSDSIAIPTITTRNSDWSRGLPATVLDQLQLVTTTLVVAVAAGCGVFPLSGWLQFEQGAPETGERASRTRVRTRAGGAWPGAWRGALYGRWCRSEQLIISVLLPAGLASGLLRIPATAVADAAPGMPPTAALLVPGTLAAISALVLALAALARETRSDALHFLAASQSSLILAATLNSSAVTTGAALAAWSALPCCLFVSAIVVEAAGTPGGAGRGRSAVVMRMILVLATLLWLASSLYLVTALQSGVSTAGQCVAIVALLQLVLSTAVMVRLCLSPDHSRARIATGLEPAASRHGATVPNGVTPVVALVVAAVLLAAMPAFLFLGVRAGLEPAWFDPHTLPDLLSSSTPSMLAVLLGTSVAVIACHRARQLPDWTVRPARCLRTQLYLNEFTATCVVRPLEVASRGLAGSLWLLSEWGPGRAVQLAGHITGFWSRSIANGSRVWYLLALMLGLAVLLQLLTY